MENASKALLMAASLLIGLIIFVIFIYEMTIMSDTSNAVNDEMRKKQISEFNAQFEGFANRRNGYLKEELEEKHKRPIENTISVQDLVALCNLTREWNQNNESDQIEITIINGNMPNYRLFMSYLKKDGANYDKPLKNLLTKLAIDGDLDKYYFICASTIEDSDSQGLKYENDRRKNICC